MNTRPPRKRVHALSQGRGANERLVIPLAFEVAARISARPLEQFLTDATQLANGLLELQRAIGADGIFCAAASGMELASSAAGNLDVEHWLRSGTPVHASLEATRRLRQTLGDNTALVAGVSGPSTLARQFNASFEAAALGYTALVKHYCEAGADIVLVFEDWAPESTEAWADALRTSTNVVRFHRGVTLLWDQDASGVARPLKVPLDAPVPIPAGIVMTAERVAEDASIEALRHWVRSVGGA